MMIRKVVIIGPESTGKSTLTESLARHYATAWTPEYAREFLAHLQGPYREAHLLEIARGQLAAEQQAEQQARGGLLFCDTDLYVIKVWSEHRFGSCDPWILRQIASRRYDLYLLSYIDVPWEDDPQREYPSQTMRRYFYEVYRDIVQQSGAPWVDIRGTASQRLARATAYIDRWCDPVRM
jgi:NadR type nicotinamide-nucleotide adenylyltransferase